MKFRHTNRQSLGHHRHYGGVGGGKQTVIVVVLMSVVVEAVQHQTLLLRWCGCVVGWWLLRSWRSHWGQLSSARLRRQTSADRERRPRRATDGRNQSGALSHAATPQQRAEINKLTREMTGIINSVGRPASVGHWVGVDVSHLGRRSASHAGRMVTAMPRGAAVIQIESRSPSDPPSVAALTRSRVVVSFLLR